MGRVWLTKLVLFLGKNVCLILTTDILGLYIWCSYCHRYSFTRVVGYCSIMLDKRFRSECLKLGMKFNYPVSNRYHTLLRQRHIQVAGISLFYTLTG